MLVTWKQCIITPGVISLIAPPNFHLTYSVAFFLNLQQYNIARTYLYLLPCQERGKKPYLYSLACPGLSRSVISPQFLFSSFHFSFQGNASEEDPETQVYKTPPSYFLVLHLVEEAHISIHGLTYPRGKAPQIHFWAVLGLHMSGNGGLRVSDYRVSGGTLWGEEGRWGFCH